ncbi:uncharacterized protein RsfS312 [Chironomus tepperi]|uniref:uncharacterized protein RsfS312 n=1 Tax=Chironomus tepperi TaxID=113505 RepID=UPI00391F18E0
MLRRIRTFNKIYNSYRTVSCSAWLKRSDEINRKNDDISSSVATKFQVFRNESVGEILDIEEERAKFRQRAEEQIIDVEEPEVETLPSIYSDLNLERGKTGVFDIEEFVDLLNRENAIDLCVIKVPEQYSYVDYLVIVTGSTYRHMLGITSFVRKVYKMKKGKHDPIPKIEGKNCKNWMAMDLGNIALHVFTKESRELYNLESLWLLGEEYERRIRGTNQSQSDSLYQEFFVDSKTLAERDSKEKNLFKDNDTT